MVISGFSIGKIRPGSVPSKTSSEVEGALAVRTECPCRCELPDHVLVELGLAVGTWYAHCDYLLLKTRDH